jgi:hypothetical protein
LGSDTGVREAAEKAGLRLKHLESRSSEGTEPIEGYLGLDFAYSHKRDCIPILAPKYNHGIAYWIAVKVSEIRDKADGRERRIGIVADKGGLRLTEESLIRVDKETQPSIASILAQAEPHYRFVDVRLDDGRARIDPALEGLIITQPSTPYTRRELQRIDEFLMEGKPLVAFVGAATMMRGDHAMTLRMQRHGLEPLLSGYGIDQQQDVLFDWEQLMRIPLLNMRSGKKDLRWLYLPGISQIKQEEGALDDHHPAFFHLDEVAVPYPSSLSVHASRQPEATFRVLLRTGPKSEARVAPLISVAPSEEAAPGSYVGPKPIAVSVRGLLRSAFPEQLPENAPRVSKRPSEVMVVGSQLFFLNPFAFAGHDSEASPDEVLSAISQPYAQKYLTATILVMKNTIDGMLLGGVGITPEEAAKACSPK